MDILDHGNSKLAMIFTTMKANIFKMNFVQMAGYIVFGSETSYSRTDPTSADTSRQTQPVQRTLNIQAFLEPFRMLADYRVFMATVAYSITFNFTLVLAPVEIPAIYTPLFHLNPQQIGLNFLSLLVGYVFSAVNENLCKVINK